MKRLTVLVTVLFLGLLALIQHAEATSPTSYTFKTLDPPGAYETEALDVNKHGQVVGAFYHANPPLPGIWDAFIWDSRSGFATYQFPGCFSDAVAVNDVGQMAVECYSYLFPYRAQPENAFVWPIWIHLNPLQVNAPSRREITGINDLGQVVGDYSETSPWDSHGFEMDSHGFIMDKNSGTGWYNIVVNENGVSSLTTLDEPFVPTASGVTHVTAINNSGQVVGFYLSGNGFIWESSSGFTQLDEPNAQGTYPDKINDRGQVVGYYSDSTGNAHGFIWDSWSGFTTLDDPNATNGTYAKSTNNLGQVVGYYSDGTGNHGFVWDSRNGFTTLDDPNGSGGTSCASINDLGVIAGTYVDSTGSSHGFVAYPVPGPTFVGANNQVGFEPLSSTYSFSQDSTGCPAGFVGVFSFSARLTNTSQSNLSNPLVQVDTLSGGNLLLNANDGPGGTGSLMSIPHIDGLNDAVLSPGEFVDVPFQVCVQSGAPFSFLVDVVKRAE